MTWGKDTEMGLRQWLNTLRIVDPSGHECSLSQIAAQIAQETQAESCSIFLADSLYTLVLAATTHAPLAGLVGEASYREGEGLTGWVFKNRQELHISDIGSVDSLKHYQGLEWRNKYIDSTTHRAWAAAPLSAGSLVVGVVRVTPRQRDFSDAQIDALRVFSRHIAGEIVRASDLPTRAWATEELYRPSQIRIEVLRHINDRVIAHFAEHPDDLHHLHPRVFEELIAELLSADGWKTELTLPTHDGGFDIRAVRNDGGLGEVLLLVEAKRYRADRPVGVDVIRRLYAVKQMMHGTKAMIATTSHVSRDAKMEFRDFMFELQFREYQDIVSWLKRYYRPS